MPLSFLYYPQSTLYSPNNLARFVALISMAVNIAFTSAVNKPGQDVILTAEDVWKGILMTVRQPQDFVDYISKVDILEDTGSTLRRVLHFVPGASHKAPGGKLDQNVTFIPNYKVTTTSPTILA